MTVNSLMQVYLRSTPTAASVMKLITEPTVSNAAHATAISFLMRNMKKDELSDFYWQLLLEWMGYSLL